MCEVKDDAVSVSFEKIRVKEWLPTVVSITKAKSWAKSSFSSHDQSQLYIADSVCCLL